MYESSLPFNIFTFSVLYMFFKFIKNFSQGKESIMLLRYVVYNCMCNRTIELQRKVSRYLRYAQYDIMPTMCRFDYTWFGRVHCTKKSQIRTLHQKKIFSTVPTKGLFSKSEQFCSFLGICSYLQCFGVLLFLVVSMTTGKLRVAAISLSFY